MKKKKSALRSAPKRCVMGANESEICKTADELSKLFNPADVDAPDALLGDSPTPRNVVNACVFSWTLFFPGRSAPRRWMLRN